MTCMRAAATSVSAAPTTTSTGIIGLPRLPMAVPSVSPSTAAGSKQANTMSASATRNCTSPYANALRPGARVSAA